MAPVLTSPFRTRRKFVLLLSALVLLNVVVYFMYRQNDSEIEKLTGTGEPTPSPPSFSPPLPPPFPSMAPYKPLHGAPTASSFSTIIKLVQQGRSEMPKTEANHPLSKRFSFAVCCITRNEPHLKEFLVRNFMAGVEHFYIYDHNHVSEGQDVDITPVLRSWMDLGIVTHIRWPIPTPSSQDPQKSQATDKPKEKFGPLQKAKFMEHCLRTYNHTADWMLRIDTDEHILVVPPDHTLLGEQDGAEKSATAAYFQRPSASLQKLGYTYPLWPLLEYAKKVPKDAGSLLMQWMITYPNHTVLASKTKPLLDTFPRVCTPRHDLPKPMFRPEIVLEMHDHWVPKRKNGAKEISSPWPHKQPLGQNPAHAGAIIVHYYAKSVQEFLTKKEQSLAGYTRMLNNMYYKENWGASTLCDKRLINYPAHYHDTTHLLMDLLQHVPNQGTFSNAFKGPKPLVYGQHKDFALYQFLKWTVSERMEWDEDAYLRMHPQLESTIAQSNTAIWPYVDGLHFYLRDGFWGGNATCWKVMDPLDENSVKDTICF